MLARKGERIEDSQRGCSRVLAVLVINVDMFCIVDCFDLNRTKQQNKTINNRDHLHLYLEQYFCSFHCYYLCL